MTTKRKNKEQRLKGRINKNEKCETVVVYGSVYLQYIRLKENHD